MKGGATGKTRSPKHDDGNEKEKSTIKGTGRTDDLVGTGGYNLHETEVVLHYRFQMAAITRTGVDEVASEDGERVVKKLRDIAATALILLSQKEGNVKGGVEGIIGGTLLVLYTDGDMALAYLGQRYRLKTPRCWKGSLRKE